MFTFEIHEKMTKNWNKMNQNWKKILRVVFVYWLLPMNHPVFTKEKNLGNLETPGRPGQWIDVNAV